jgi:hypothetical protein
MNRPTAKHMGVRVLIREQSLYGRALKQGGVLQSRHLVIEVLYCIRRITTAAKPPAWPHTRVGTRGCVRGEGRRHVDTRVL